MDSIIVESYAGTKAEERPCRFYINKRKIEISAVEKSWLTPESRCFKVAGDDGYSYVLEYNGADDSWSLLTVNKP